MPIDAAEQLDYLARIVDTTAPRTRITRLPRHALAAMACALVAGPASVHAGSVVVTIIDGRKAHADIALPAPGGGSYTAEFEIEFDNPQNLTVACLGLDADVLDATEIADVESRMPDVGNQVIDGAFPVRVTVEPPVGCGLQFDDEVHVEYHTIDLVYAPFSPYRLMKAPLGLGFHDVTGAVVSGSVRARGSGGSFSEFVIAKTLVQDYAGDADAGYDALEARIDDPAIGLSAQLTLQADLDVSRAAFDAANYAQAIARLDDLDLHCAALGGPALPNTWRSARDLVNAEGELVTLSGNIKFALGRLDGVP
ncbi:DUF6689 family protein [Dokdonella sp.]|uniref:DUF6689 family protein n=1 Tax=Dokdonella sp. TaxID=2291710 RepID=UPI002F407488